MFSLTPVMPLLLLNLVAVNIPTYFIMDSQAKNMFHKLGFPSGNVTQLAEYLPSMQETLVNLQHHIKVVVLVHISNHRTQAMEAGG